jgi:transcriptional regulator with XRE-family HTH domain
LALLRFAGKVKRLRRRLKLSLTDVAARSGIDKGALSRLENGHVANVTLSTLERLATSLGKRVRIELEDPAQSA